MRIVSRAKFLSMPAGTLFAKYKPCVFGDLLIKCETTLHNDFRYQRIADAIDCDGSEEFVDLLGEAEETGCSISMMFDDEMRDGMFDDSQLFAVFERQDVVALISRLQMALADGYPQRSEQPA